MDIDQNSLELIDRILWRDGDSTIPAEQVEQYINAGISTKGLFVDHLTDEIKQYNKYVEDAEQIVVKKQLRALSFDWNLPEEFATLDVATYVSDQFVNKFGDIPHADLQARALRLQKEYIIYKKCGLINLLRTLIYVINTLAEKKVVWGIGRGSSVSSYLLYVIGVHDVDSVLYDLDFEDFIGE